MYTKDERGYAAVFEAQTSGLLGLITANRKEVMKSIMEYDQANGRLRPLMFQEVFTQAGSEIKKTLSFSIIYLILNIKSRFILKFRIR